jgi:O-methyltransferase involved in polyketide biosynthesis
VLAHARALLADSPEGLTSFVEADARDTARVLAEAGRTLDLDQPVAVIMLGLLGNIPDDGEARAVVTAIVDAVPPGSFLVVNDGTRTSDEITAGAQAASDGGHPYALRPPEEIAAYFAGLELVEPGLVPTTHWRPPGGEVPATLDGLGGVARKP